MEKVKQWFTPKDIVGYLIVLLIGIIAWIFNDFHDDFHQSVKIQNNILQTLAVHDKQIQIIEADNHTHAPTVVTHPELFGPFRE